MVIVGIGTWQRDFLGKRRIELAEEALALFYRAREAIDHIRDPVSFGVEADPSPKRERESDTHHQARMAVAPIHARYKQYSELFSEIAALKFRFMARFGQETAAPFDDFRRIISSILANTVTYVRDSDRGNFLADASTQKKWADRQEKSMSVIWSGGEVDATKDELDRVVLAIEKTCRTAIEESILPIGPLSNIIRSLARVYSYAKSKACSGVGVTREKQKADFHG
jgi:hypothetical protein